MLELSGQPHQQKRPGSWRSTADARFSLARVQLKSGDVSAATEQYNALKEIDKAKADELQKLINESTRAK